MISTLTTVPPTPSMTGKSGDRKEPAKRFKKCVCVLGGMTVSKGDGEKERGIQRERESETDRIRNMNPAQDPEPQRLNEDIGLCLANNQAVNSWMGQ